MNIAIYGLTIKPDFIDELSGFFNLLKQKDVSIYIYEPFSRHLAQECCIDIFPTGVFNSGEELPENISFMFSIGGDGTFLKSFLILKDKSIPLVGINSGRLGFLSDISRKEIDKVLDDIFAGNYIIDERSVLQLETEKGEFADFNYALNEITVTKLDSSSMINIHTFLNGELLNTYWADGLIVATPTGSTAYSLSVGGPILTPDSENFVISPIAPHNLTVRPIVVPDHNSIILRIEGRGNQFLASVDSRSAAFDFSSILKIRKADFKVKTIRLNDHSFFATLRSKLMWGADKRN